jgi:hypothetical protein
MNIQSSTFGNRPQPEAIAFDRKELGVILGLYGRMVAAGEWRDYGISHLTMPPSFPCFGARRNNRFTESRSGRSCEMRKGMYSVIALDGRILKRGHDLKTVLRVLERKLIRAIG